MIEANSEGKRPQHRICGLDGIRAISFFLVVCGHSGFAWIPNGFGVTVFFFLSGYLITTLLRKEWIKTGSISVSHFYIRRAFRILPPLFIAVVLEVVLVLVGLTRSEIHWQGLALVLLFLTNCSGVLFKAAIPDGLSTLWSLAVEEHFYLLFPCVYRHLLKRAIGRNWQVLFFSAICLIALLWRTVLMTSLHSAWFRVYSGTDTRLDSILFGSIMAIAVNPAIDRLNGLRKPLCMRAAMIGFVILLVSIALRGEMFRQTVRYTIQGLALVPIFLFITRYSESAITRFLETKVLVHIGELSYSLYLVHSICLATITVWVKTGPFVTLLLTFTLSYIIALTMHIYVELPSYRMRDWVLRQLGTKDEKRAWRKAIVVL
jgi:peptidoglycan/LPS O-acetylase OafA/YrhL